MKLIFKIRILLLCGLMCLTMTSVAQTTKWIHDVGAVNVATGSVTFRSHVGDPSDPEDIKKMIHLDYGSLYGLNPDLSGGIKGTIHNTMANGSIYLRVFAYDTAATHGKGALIYEKFIEGSHPNNFAGQTSNVSVSVLGATPSWELTGIPSDNIRVLSEEAKVYINANGTPACRDFNYNWLNGFQRMLTGDFFSTEFRECLAYYNAKQPVVIEASVHDATFTKMKIPGIGELTPSQAFLEEADQLRNELSSQNSSVSVGHDVRLTTELVNHQPYGVTISNASIQVKNLKTGARQDHGHTLSLVDFTIGAQGTHNMTNKVVLGSLNTLLLDPGSYGVFLNYSVTQNNSNVKDVYSIPITFFRKRHSGEKATYDVVKHDHSGLPVYTLSGGFSAEYCVEKSLAALDAGISETWDVRNQPNGQPDLADGGPKSVYGGVDFLDASVQKTVSLYNALGATRVYNTVIIGAGPPSVPYMSYAMDAPFLPMHFATETFTLGEVVAMVDHANENGYSAYATAGYDPSVPGEGSSWIKLLEIPQAYKDFMVAHNVQNVLIVGSGEQGFGENQARKLITNTTPASKYGEGSIWVMTHGGLDELQSRYTDLNRWILRDEIEQIADWESGIADIQVEQFSADIRGMNASIGVYNITGHESVDFYNIAIDFMLAFWKKNEHIGTAVTPQAVALNEYVIGYPGYESYHGQVPFLYWQGLPPEWNIARVFGTLKDKIAQDFPSVNFSNLDFIVNAKANRGTLVTALQQKGLNHVSQNTWQKADVWDPSDGYHSPVEVAAQSIVNSPGGYNTYRTWINGRTKLTITDLISWASTNQENREKADTHPNPSSTATIKNWSGDGLQVKQYNYASSDYWQVQNFAHRMPMNNLSSGYPGNRIGWIDGKLSSGRERAQRVTVMEFDLHNASDEYDLQVGYQFNPLPEDGFPYYHAADGDQQDMACFEYVKVPKTHWMDIPSRMMARKGAILAINGSVYDFDYNGLPGVAPFIKVNNVIKAQPQILTYKAEAAFAWNWGTSKSVSLFGRPKEISGTGIVSNMSTLFHNETQHFPNVLGGMTYMTGNSYYNIENLQPQWMLDYPEFDAAYLGPSGTYIRCYLANPGGPTGPCERYLIETGGNTAPSDEGWNDCSRLVNDEDVRRFSALAYRQYDLLFDAIPNSRAFVAVRGNQLDIGVIDGDLGSGGNLQEVINDKKWGMHNWEVSNYVRYKGYDHYMNLDGGSSAQIWLNGRGPLHDWTGYPLANDNQGPYYSRLISSYILVVPKQHIGQIKTFQIANHQFLRLDNSHMNFDYDDDADHTKDKAYMSLSMNLDSLNLTNENGEGEVGVIAGNFRITNDSEAEGAILFALGEDSYYPDTEGSSLVIPEFRNLMVAGVGKIPSPLLDSLQHKLVVDNTQQHTYSTALEANNQAFYFIKLHKGKVVRFFTESTHNDPENLYKKYIDNQWHSFMIRRDIEHDGSGISDDIHIDGTIPQNVNNYSSTGFGHMFNIDTATHASVGAVNVDGRFVTGNATLDIDNLLIVPGYLGTGEFTPDQENFIEQTLHSHRYLPNGTTIKPKYYRKGVYAFQFEEIIGQHSFAMNASTSHKARLYGLNLNTERVNYAQARPAKAVEEVAEESGVAELTVYPNPNEGSFTIHLSSEEAAEGACVELYDLEGRALLASSETCFADGVTEILMTGIKEQGIPAGLYLLKVFTSTGTETRRIIIQ